MPSSAFAGAIAPFAAAPGRPDWATDGADWPNRAASRFFRADGFRWHVQIAGSGPVLLLLHGTGAATHSWRDLLPLLAEHYTVVAPDLPGHGFTEAPAHAKMSLPGMARSLGKLLGQLGLSPALAAGHSAGAAILLRMALDGLIAPAKIAALNGALLPYGGEASAFFAPLARLIARNRLMPVLFSWHASDMRVVERLLAGTGSRLDAAGTQFYARLARRSGHAGAALAMMGNWELPPLLKEMPRLRAELLLVTGENDRAIPPADAGKLQKLLPSAKILRLNNLGHLAHEEAPGLVAGHLREFFA